jgi:lipopolysaccharide transport system permease protein
MGFYFYFYSKGAPINLTLWIFALPLLVLQMALLSLGLGILISSLTTKYKDLRFAMGFFIQLWMYATPIVYPLTQIPEWLLPYYILNPMVALVESFRFSFFGTSAIQWSQIIISWGMTVAIVFFGIIIFSHQEKTFMDTI